MTSTAGIEESIAWDRIGLVDLLNVIAKDWEIPLASLRAVRPGASRSTGRPPSPVPVALSDARADVAVSLFGWCRVLIEDRHLEHASAHMPDVPAMCALMVRHADWWTSHEAHGDMLDELRGRAERLHLVANPPAHSRAKIGHCPLTVGDLDTPCPGVVIADPDTGVATCTRCRTRERVDWWRERMPLAQFITLKELTAAMVYEGLPMAERAVRSAIDKGAIEIAGYDHRGRRLVDRAAAILELKRRRRPKAS